MQKRAVLAMVVKTLAGLHGRSIVHGALSPSAVIWHSQDNAMKVADLCCAAPPGQLAPHVTPTLRFSPPEVRSPRITPHTRLCMSGQQLSISARRGQPCALVLLEGWWLH